jgi:hypothetical protein
MRRFGAQRSTQRQLDHPTRLKQEPGLGVKCNNLLGDSLSYINRRSEESNPLTRPILNQKLTTLDSATSSANCTASMSEAFNVFRSSSATPRAAAQGPQTYTGTFPASTFSISCGRGGKPTPCTLFATFALAR